MARPRFWIFDTAGNTTCFADSLAALALIPNWLGCEQAGCADIDKASVQMAGGEFCANACLAFAALSHMAGSASRIISMAGVRLPIEAAGQCPVWQTRARLPAHAINAQDGQAGCVARLPGIAHLLVESAEESAQTAEKGQQMLQAHGLCGEPAAGVIWWRRNGARLTIRPLVAVPAAGVINMEGACGSGSIALAHALGPGEYEIEQPSGAVLHVANRNGEIALTASTRLAARGEIC